MTVVEQTDALYGRMFRNRLDPNGDYDGWQSQHHDLRGTAKTFIHERLAEGCRVRTGYFTTACRGFHRHVVLWRDRP